MTKKDIERIDRKTDGINTIAYMALIFGLSAILILIFNTIFNTPPQGTWECVEWEEETYTEYSVECEGYLYDSWDNWTRVSNNVEYIQSEDVCRFGYMVYGRSTGEIQFEIKTRQGDCIKEQLVREVKRE